MEKKIIVKLLEVLMGDKEVSKEANNNNYDDSFIGKEVIVRSYGSGVWIGYLKKTWTEEKTSKIILGDAQRIWRWVGSSECVQLAMEGVSKPKECKFTMKTDLVRIENVVEIIPCTDKASQSIRGVDIWKK